MTWHHYLDVCQGGGYWLEKEDYSVFPNNRKLFIFYNESHLLESLWKACFYWVLNTNMKGKKSFQLLIEEGDICATAVAIIGISTLGHHEIWVGFYYKWQLSRITFAIIFIAPDFQEKKYKILLIVQILIHLRFYYCRIKYQSSRHMRIENIPKNTLNFKQFFFI